MPYRSPARWLGPLAILAAVAALYAVIASGGATEDSGGVTTPAAGGAGTRTTASGRAPKRASRYTVRPGDVLSVIAERTNVSVERLQRLNPGVDAQSLRPGQRLKLEP